MQFYLMRHAEAESPGMFRGPDRDRPLSIQGLADVHTAAQLMEQAGLAISTVITSPFVRCWETARIVQGNLTDCVLKVDDSLACGAKAEAYRKLILTTQEKQPLLIVGHNPEISVFMCKLTGVPQYLDNLAFEKGEMMYVDTGNLSEGWETGRMIWRRLITQWSQKIPT